MWETFATYTGLQASQVQTIQEKAIALKDSPLHTNLTQKAKTAIFNQDNASLALLCKQGTASYGFLYPLVLLQAAFPSILSLFGNLALDEQIRRDTLSDISLWVKVYEKYHRGETGLEQVDWISRSCCAKVIRFGRLQYEKGIFRFPYSIYYDRLQKTYRTFAHEGLFCDEKGFLVDEEQGFSKTSYLQNSDFLRAHEVNQAKGCIAKEPTKRPLASLVLLCEKDDLVVHIHIPEGEMLTPVSVEDSLLQAKTYFSSCPIFVCASWLLDPELLQVSNPDGNICRFMQRFFKFPIAFGTPQIYERVFDFGCDKECILTYDCTTSLQRQVQNHLKQGRTFHTMGGYIPLSCPSPHMEKEKSL